MQIVINIPEDVYKWCSEMKNIENSDTDWGAFSICAIKNGTPLPKGHGRLIDADELYLDIQTDEEMRLGEHIMWVKERFDNAPTIIPADKEEV